MFKRALIVATASIVALGGIGVGAAHAQHNDSYLEEHVVEPVVYGVFGAFGDERPDEFVEEHVVEPVVYGLYGAGSYTYDYLEDGAEELFEELADEWYDHGGGYVERGAEFLIWGSIIAAYWTYDWTKGLCPTVDVHNVPYFGQTANVPIGFCLFGLDD